MDHNDDLSKQALIAELDHLRLRVRELEDDKRKTLAVHTEVKWRRVLEQTPLIGVSLDLQGIILFANTSFLELTGWTATEVVGQDWFTKFIPPEKRDRIHRVFNQAISQTEIGEYAKFENEIVTRSGECKHIAWVNMLDQNAEGKIRAVTSLGVDLTETLRAESINRARLRLMEDATSKSHSELLIETVDIAENLTNSQIGFIHFLEKDQNTIALQAWSTKTVKFFCTAMGKGTHYDLDMAGIWADSIRLRAPVIHNDYPDMEHKQGLPPGHAAIQRELVVPVIRANKVMAILGVGNKPSDYNDADIKIVSQLADLTWDTTEGRRLEEKARRMYRLMTEAQNLAQVGGWELDLTTDTFHWTESLYRMFGFKPDEIKNNHQYFIEHIVHPDDQARINDSLKTMLTAKTDASLEYKIIRKDGKVRDITTKAVPELDDKGKLRRIYGVNLDITRRNEIEEELRHNLILNMSLARLYHPIVSDDTTIETASSVFLQEAQKITGSADGYVSAVNEEGELVIHAHSDTLNMNTLAAEDTRIIFPATNTGPFPKLWGHSRNKTPPDDSNNKGTQSSTLKKPGHDETILNVLEVPVLLGFTLVGQIVLANKPDDFTRRDMEKVTRLASYYSLALQRLKHREALTSSRDLMQSILTGIRAAIVQIDPKTMLIDTVNDVALKMLGGPTKETYVGKSCEVLCGKADNECKSEKCPAQHTQLINKEMFITRYDGTSLPIQKTVLREVVNGQEKILEVFFDISERKDLERRLTLAQKLESIGQLSAGIAHEINTPIQYLTDNLKFLSTSFGTVLGMVNRLQHCVDAFGKGPEGGEKHQTFHAEWRQLDMDYILDEIPQALTQSLEGVNRVTKIVRAMKRFSHPGMSNMQHADINEALQTTVTISKNEWKYHATVAYTLAEDIPPVPCMLNDLNQVFLNVLVNASQAITEKFEQTGEHGTISIRTWHDDQQVWIEISDTGTGIPESVMPKIFDPFFTTKEVGLGTGQGLALCYSIVVDKHHGTIDFTSEIGVGTTCTISLPLSGVGKEDGK